MHQDILATLAIYQQNDIIYIGYKCDLGIVINDIIYYIYDDEIVVKSAKSWNELYKYSKFGIAKYKKYNFNIWLSPTYMHYISSDIHILLEIDISKKLIHYYITTWKCTEYKMVLKCNDIIDIYSIAINKYIYNTITILKNDCVL